MFLNSRALCIVLFFYLACANDSPSHSNVTPCSFSPGLYYSDCKVKEPRAHAKDDEVDRKLWELSEKLCKL